MILQFKTGLFALALVTLAWAMPCLPQVVQPDSPDLQRPGANSLDESSSGQLTSGQPMPGSISGTVIDQSGALVSGAYVRLTGTAQAQPALNQPALSQEVLSGPDGQFLFPNIAPGPFELTITSVGFATQTYSGVLHSGETEIVPQIVLPVATSVTEVKVGLTRAEEVEVAEAELKIEEKQRVLGVIPNFYVSYVPDAAPLTPKQKFKLAFRTVIDPFTFVIVGGAAGVEQAQNHFIGYGQGAEGYALRFGAGYGDTVSGTFIGGAILPALLKQDPRYFYKGIGSVRSRFLYAIANSLICKGDNKRWQVNYSNILGSLAAGGISNLYYPSQDRDGAELTFENAAIGIASTAVANLFQEFLIRKLTPRLPKQDPATP